MSLQQLSFSVCLGYKSPVQSLSSQEIQKGGNTYLYTLAFFHLKHAKPGDYFHNNLAKLLCVFQRIVKITAKQ